LGCKVNFFDKLVVGEVMVESEPTTTKKSVTFTITTFKEYDESVVVLGLAEPSITASLLMSKVTL